MYEIEMNQYVGRIAYPVSISTKIDGGIFTAYTINYWHRVHDIILRMLKLKHI